MHTLLTLLGLSVPCQGADAIVTLLSSRHPATDRPLFSVVWLCSSPARGLCWIRLHCRPGCPSVWTVLVLLELWPICCGDTTHLAGAVRSLGQAAAPLRGGFLCPWGSEARMPGCPPEGATATPCSGLSVPSRWAGDLTALARSADSPSLCPCPDFSGWGWGAEAPALLPLPGLRVSAKQLFFPWHPVLGCLGLGPCASSSARSAPPNGLRTKSFRKGRA